MASYRFDWVDAFTDRAFGGNGCAVLHDAAGLDDETCKAVVRETSLVECTFVGPSARADWHVRYFVARAEIPFAGHPTIATVASLIDRGLVAGEAVTLETGAGLVACTIDRAGALPVIEMTQVAPVFGAELPAEVVAAAGGLAPEDIAAPPQVVSTGLPFCIALLRDHEALRRVALDPDGMRDFKALAGAGEPQASEPYWVVLGGATDAGDTFARLLLEPPSPAEDSFTGSATGAAAAWLWRHGFIDSPAYTAEQGHWMGRPGSAAVEVLGPPDAITGVKVAGTGYVLMRGEVAL